MEHIKVHKDDRDLSEEIAAIKADLAALRADLRSGLHTAFEQGKEKIRNAKDSVVDAAQNATVQSREYIEENPFKSVSIALGVGVLTGAVLGLIIGRR